MITSNQTTYSMHYSSLILLTDTKHYIHPDTISTVLRALFLHKTALLTNQYTFERLIHQLYTQRTSISTITTTVIYLYRLKSNHMNDLIDDNNNDNKQRNNI